jgi:hypothetical protein
MLFILAYFASFSQVPEHLFMRCVDPMRWTQGLHVAVKYIETIGEGTFDDVECE